MVGPQDGGFGFDQSKKYTSVDNLEEICVQCQAGQHKNCLKKAKKQDVCECEHCMIYGWFNSKSRNFLYNIMFKG